MLTQLKKLRSLLKSRKGAALIVAMLLLIILTVLGLAAIQTSTTDIEIAANERRAQCVFYASEAGVQAAMEQLARKDLDPIPLTSIANDAFFRSGPICPDTDGNGVCDVDEDGNIVSQPIDLVGLVAPAGFSPQSGYDLYGFQITGICGTDPEAPEALMKEIEVKARRFRGSVRGGTNYNVGL
jgi:hypothetical protein